MSETIESVLLAIQSEVARATRKFPTWPTDPIHAAAVVSEEMGELVKAVTEATYEPHKADSDDVHQEALQTAAMAVRFLMSMDRYIYSRCHQHEQEPQP